MQVERVACSDKHLSRSLARIDEDFNMFPLSLVHFHVPLADILKKLHIGRTVLEGAPGAHRCVARWT